MDHTSPSRKQAVKAPTDRNFGLTFAGVFCFLAIVLAWKGSDYWPHLLAVAAVFAVLSFVRPQTLSHLNRLWMKFGALLHRVTTPLIIGAIFFVVITPMALALRLLRRDPLGLRFDPEAASYWIDRTPPGPAPDSMPRQF